MKNNLTQFPSGIVTRGHGRTDHAFGVGGRLGGQWNVSQFLSFGAAVATPIFFQKLSKYRDVIKHAPRLPAIATAGIAWHMRKDTDFLFDLEGLFWKESPFTGKRPPIGQGWRNVLVFKFGVQHKINPDLQLRLGYNYGRTPVPNNAVLFNALDEVITITEHVLSTGFTYNLNPGMSFDLGGAILFNKKITDNGKGPAGLAAKGLNVEARGLLLSLGFNIKY
jgi:long-chain fatty acid transport protein